EIIYLVLIIGRDRVSLTVQLKRSVLVEQKQSNSEKLKDLAGVVFVRIILGAPHHVQVISHSRIERYVLHQLPKITESILRKLLMICDHPARLLRVDT